MEFLIGLASSTQSDLIRNHLEREGMKDYFSIIVGGDMVEHAKPLPDIYLLACERLGVKPEDAYAIEDSPNGIRAAHGVLPLPKSTKEERIVSNAEVFDFVISREDMDALCE